MTHNQLSEERDNGFTIVELAVAIIVIAILATISIVAYNGIQSRAAEAALRSDLNNGIQLTELAKASDGTGDYPEDLSTVDNGKPFTPSGDNQYVYTRRDGISKPEYCLITYNAKHSIVAWIDNDSKWHEMKSPQEGTELDGCIGGNPGASNIGYGVTSADPLTVGPISAD